MEDSVKSLAEVNLDHKKIWYHGYLISQKREECHFSALKAGQEWVQNSSSHSTDSV